MLDDKDEKGAVVINEAAVKAFGWNAPIGKEINGEYRVKGVIKIYIIMLPYIQCLPGNVLFTKE